MTILKSRCISTTSLLIASFALSFMGCATTTPAEQPKTPDFSCSTRPTAATTGKVVATTLLGAALDKATGGGKGFERAMGRAADENLHKKCQPAEGTFHPL
jgi:hypothetical protein